MDNKNSAVEEFLGKANASQEDSDSFISKNEDPFNGKFEDGQDKNEQGGKPGEEDTKPEKPLPFHKDPKVQRYIQDEIKKITSSMTPQQAARVEKDISESDDLVAAFTEIIGNDTPQKVNALTKLNSVLKGFESKATEATRKLEADRKAEEDAENELNSGIASVEDAFEIDLSSDSPASQKVRREYLDFLGRVAPKNAAGDIVAYPDFQETFKLFQETKKKSTPSNARNRELASRSMQPSSEASGSPVPRDYSWKGVDKHLSKIKG